jgi:hypothetical protein
MRRAWLGVIVLVGYGASLWANFPGHFSPDSLWQLTQGRLGVYNEWHPPAMAWLLGLADRLTPGAPLFIVFDGAIFFGGLLAFATLEERPRLFALPVLALVVASPLVLIYQGMVWKDVLFADVSVAAFAALAWAARVWTMHARRSALLIVAFTLFALAGLTRQSGWVAPVCGAAALFAIGLMAQSPKGAARGVALRSLTRALLAIFLVGLVAGVAAWSLAARDDGRPETARQIVRLQVFDLAGATRADPSLDLSILRRQAPLQERFIRKEAAPVWSADSADNLLKLPMASLVFMRPDPAVGRQWRALVLGRPDLYARVRSNVFAATLMASTAHQCPAIFTGVDSGNPVLLEGAGLKARYDAKDAWDEDYETTFLETPVFSHLCYGGVLIALLIWIAVDIARGDRRPELAAVAAMEGSAVLFAASFLVISSACDYRYLYFLDVAAMVGLVHRASTPSSHGHARRRRSATLASRPY